MKYIFLPGMLCDKRLWQTQITYLAEHGIAAADMVVADLTKDDNIAAMAERVLKNVTGDFHIIAFSLGTQVAAEIIKMAPERVKSLVLFASACGALTSKIKQVLAEAKQAAATDFDAYLNDFFPKYLAAYGINYDTTRQTFMAMAKALGQDVCLRQLTALLTSTVTKNDLRKIAYPTLIVAGAKDRRLPPQVQHELQATIPHSELKFIADVEHFSMLQAPDEVNQILAEWLTVANN